MKIQHSKSRLEGFSDAVFGFAATLLVVSLEIPDSFSILKEQIFGYIPFAISFFALVMIWKLHYNYFRRIERLDNWIFALNMLMVFTVLYFVYPLKFLMNLAFRGSSVVTLNEFSELFQLYSFGFLMLFASIALLYWRSAFLEKEKRPMLSYFARHFGIFVLVSLLSIVLAKLQVGLQWGFPGVIYAILGPLCWFHGYKWGYEEADQVLKASK